MNYAGFTHPIWSWLRDPGIDIPLLGIPGPVTRLPGAVAVAAMRSFAAAMPWVSLTHSWNLLGSHDTARIRSVVATPAHVEVAAGLMLTLPGTPMIFAGDEIGMTGTWGEDARRPMPWEQRDRWDLDTLHRYRELIALRLAHPTLQDGGHRWIHLDDEAIVFLRESQHERLLILAARAASAPIVLPARALGLSTDAATNIYGGAADLPPIRPPLSCPETARPFKCGVCPKRSENHILLPGRVQQ